MRKITGHKSPWVGANNSIEIEADDRDEKYGGASHLYECRALSAPLESCTENEKPGTEYSVSVVLQHGPIKEVGVNGITLETLLAIVQDQLKDYQAGPYANEYNEKALQGVGAAITALHERTRDRLQRGVEGTMTV